MSVCLTMLCVLGLLVPMSSCHPPQSLSPTTFVEDFGLNSIRIRSCLCNEPLDGVPGAIRALPHRNRVFFPYTRLKFPQTVENGNIRAVVYENNTIVLVRISDSATLLRFSAFLAYPGTNSGYYSWIITMFSDPSEHLFGMGERVLPGNTLNLKGQTLDFRADQHNTRITIPHLISSAGYGFFLNHPGWANVTFGVAGTVWTVAMASTVDLLVSTSEAPERGPPNPYADLMRSYYMAIGFPSLLPQWATGLWASKERYSSTMEMLDITRQYVRHGLVPSVFVVDWKHYECVGDWAFTLSPEVCWSNVSATLSALGALGVQHTFVSVHPWSQPGSVSHSSLVQNELCIRNKDGEVAWWGGWTLPSTCSKAPINASHENCLYDPSNPQARDYLFRRLNSTYGAVGVVDFWTDGTEPAGTPKGGLPYDVVFFNDSVVVNLDGFLSAVLSGIAPQRSTAQAVIPSPAAFMMWPVWHAATIFAGSKGRSWSLARSAWAGSHRMNTIVWSGDISSSWTALAQQVSAGLNFQLTYPYWNTDTGGFSGGDWQTMGELISRWFQFSIFQSITRLHGNRHPREPNLIPKDAICDPTGAAGGPIEPWVYGTDAFHSIQVSLDIRRNLSSYIATQLHMIASDGVPMMRPIWFDFFGDITALDISDQFMFGSDYMVAPVLQAASTMRGVSDDVLPSNSRAIFRHVVFPGDDRTTFVDYFTGERFAGGSSRDVVVRNWNVFPFYKVERASKT